MSTSFRSLRSNSIDKNVFKKILLPLLYGDVRPAVQMHLLKLFLKTCYKIEIWMTVTKSILAALCLTKKNIIFN